MSYVKRLVCLANSYKPPSGRCIAGREVKGNNFGNWVRPVSGRDSAELSYTEYRYESGNSPRLLDIVDVPLLKPTPDGHQEENELIDTSCWWVKRGELSWDQLEQLRDRPTSIWINSGNTNVGENDCISKTEAQSVHGSLLLIKRKNFIVEIGTHYFTGKRTFRGKFQYKDVPYNFSLTDPRARDVYGARGEGEYSFENVYLCLSLTAPFDKDGRCHKLIAAVITNPAL